MNDTTSIFGMVYDELQAKTKQLPEYKRFTRAFDALDREQVVDIILDGDIFWLEYARHNDLTDQQHALLVDYIEKHKGYKYLYHTKQAIRS